MTLGHRLRNALQAGLEALPHRHQQLFRSFTWLGGLKEPPRQMPAASQAERSSNSLNACQRPTHMTPSAPPQAHVLGICLGYSSPAPGWPPG